MTDIDLSNLDPADPKAVEYLRAALERQMAATETANKEAAALRAGAHTAEVRSALQQLGAPEQIADLYPADGKTDKDSVRTFLKDRIGLDTDAMDGWKRFETRAGMTEPPPPEQDEMEVLLRKSEKDTAKFYQGQYKPTDKEVEEFNALKDKVLHGLLPKWDQDVASGQMAPLVEPSGFGGFIDPPMWARRARFHVTSL